MKVFTPLISTLAVIAISISSVTPVFAREDDDHDKGKSKSHGHSPKDEGRHDNGLHRGWDKNKGSTWSPQTRQSQSAHRQSTKNEWRNLALISGAVGVLGLLKNDGTLTFVGAAGALYSTYRYEQDRKSQNKVNRARASYFSKPYFVRDGQRYDRRTVKKDGKTYYQFVRHN